MHGREAIQAAGAEQWGKALTKYFTKTFEGMTPKQTNKLINEMYDNVVNGLPPMGDASANISSKFAKERVLESNGWEASHAYNELYGKGNMYETMIAASKATAKDLAIEYKFTSNPEKFKTDLFNDLQKRASPSELEQLKIAEKSLNASFDTATFKTDAPAKNMSARFTQGALLQQRYGLLGAVYLRAIPDFALALNEVRGKNGKGILSLL